MFHKRTYPHKDIYAHFPIADRHRKYLLRMSDSDNARELYPMHIRPSLYPIPGGYRWYHEDTQCIPNCYASLYLIPSEYHWYHADTHAIPNCYVGIIVNHLFSKVIKIHVQDVFEHGILSFKSMHLYRKVFTNLTVDTFMEHFIRIVYHPGQDTWGKMLFYENSNKKHIPKTSQI